MNKLPRALLLFGRRKLLKRFRQHRVGGAVGDVVNEILFHARERPRLADGRAALRNDAGQCHVAADGDGHAAVLKHFAVK